VKIFDRFLIKFAIFDKKGMGK